VSRFGIKKRDFVVYESTVYPGCGRRCVPILENISELKGVDFKFGYSRTDCSGDSKTLTNIIKVSGNDEEALEMIAEVYGSIIKAGLHKSKSIKVAEALKL
jgi:UDP-N-acetyl-D-galactosamine dehydrogenase